MRMYIAKSRSIAARALDGEMVIMSISDSKLFTLNEVATEIWLAADGHTLLSQIVQDRICAKFDTSPETAYADAESLCRGLAEHGILTISDQPVESAR